MIAPCKREHHISTLLYIYIYIYIYKLQERDNNNFNCISSNYHFLHIYISLCARTLAPEALARAQWILSTYEVYLPERIISYRNWWHLYRTNQEILNGSWIKYTFPTSLLGNPASVSLTVCCRAWFDSDGAERSIGWWNLQFSPNLHSPIFI